MKKEDRILKEALHRYLAAILEFLSNNTSEYTTPMEVFRSNMVHILPHQEHLEKEFAIPQLAGVQEYKEAIMNHPTIGNQINALLGTKSGASIVTIWSIVFRFVDDLLASPESTSFDESIFEENFNSMMEFFKSNTIQIQMMTPLENFDCEDSIIELPRGWRIERVPEETISKWWRNQTKISLSFGPRNYLWTKFMLLKEYSTERRIQSATKPHEESNEPLDATERTKLLGEMGIILSSLRILKSGRLISRMVQQQVIGWSVGSPGGGLSWKPHIPEIMGKQYKLISSEVPELKQIIETLEILDSNNALQIALRRLNLIIERGDVNNEDRILDSMIGLESLFLGGEKGELRYRLSMRSAIFLGNSLEEREEIRDDIQYIYDLRSYIIHGYKKDTVDKHLRKRSFGLHQAADLSEDYLRKALKGFLRELENGNTIDTTISSIDNKLLN